MANERIFVSYRRKDKEKVFALVEKIEREVGVKCWVDLANIETSAQFVSKICTAIERAEVVLFMHSSAHLDIDYDNDWTIRELNYAHDERKRVVLVKVILETDEPKSWLDYRENEPGWTQKAADQGHKGAEALAKTVVGDRRYDLPTTPRIRHCTINSNYHIHYEL